MHERVIGCHNWKSYFQENIANFYSHITYYQCTYKKSTFIIINCFTVSVTFLIMQIFYLNLPHASWWKWVYEMGKHWGLAGKKSVDQVLLFFSVKCVPVLHAKLLAIDLAIVSFWLKLLSGIPSCKSIIVLKPMKLALRYIHWNSWNNNMIGVVFFENKPVFINDNCNSPMSSISLDEKNRFKGNNSCWLDAWFTVIFTKTAHTKPVDAPVADLQLPFLIWWRNNVFLWIWYVYEQNVLLLQLNKEGFIFKSHLSYFVRILF
jgi:hypothetical protein